MSARAGLPTIDAEALRTTLVGVCTGTQWVYAVFWRILPRAYPPPEWTCGVMERSKINKRNWTLCWEDGYCNFEAWAWTANEVGSAGHPSMHELLLLLQGNAALEAGAQSPFYKMSHEVYNYGEGLIGKVAVDNSHRWVYRDPLEKGDPGALASWSGSLDAHPSPWEAQFKFGIQTIALVAVQEGVLQLGATQKVMEDLSFVLYIQRKFNFAVLHSLPPAIAPPNADHPGLPMQWSMAGPEHHTERLVQQLMAEQIGAQPLHLQLQLPSPAAARMKHPAQIGDPPALYTISGGSMPQTQAQVSVPPMEACKSPSRARKSPARVRKSLPTVKSPGKFPGGMPPTWQTLPPMWQPREPSLSSLEALLAKLPPVAMGEGGDGPNPVVQYTSFCAMYPGSDAEEAGTAGGGFTGKLPGFVRPSDAHVPLRIAIASSSSPNSSSEVSQSNPGEVEEEGRLGDMVAWENYRYHDAEFLPGLGLGLEPESFDALSELAIQEALENGDAGLCSYFNDSIC